MDYNNQQLDIINHIYGPLLCIAGPGSGKTASIIGRVQNMVRNGISPSSILVVTFTKAAADEMKARYMKLPDSDNCVTFCTIHSLCFKILKEQYPDFIKKENVLQETEQRNFIREKVRRLFLEENEQNAVIIDIINAISNLKNNDIDAEDIKIDGCSTEQFKEIFDAYEKFKEIEKYVDFDDMIAMTYKLFNEEKDVLKFWRNRYQYFIIDEFQDTNKMQADIFYTLAAPKNNICVVGDDDQCIYKFRGAVPEIMLNFGKRFKKCTKVSLTINYRSSPDIVTETRNLIEHNKKRFKKELSASCQTNGHIDYISYKNRSDEISNIVRQISAKQKQGEYLGEIAILYRTNNQGQQVAQMMSKADIPFRCNEPICHIFEHWIFRDILNFRKVAEGTCTVNEFLSVINRPNKYFARRLMPDKYSEEGVMNKIRIMPDNYWKEGLTQKMELFFSRIKELKKLPPAQAVDYIRKHLNYNQFLREYAKSSQLDVSQFYEIINEIKDSAVMFSTFESWIYYAKTEVDKFRTKIRSQKSENSVLLSTMHKSKGLEWNEVYIIDANEEIAPHIDAVINEEIEDERRLFYVAITRAKRVLHICSIKKRNDEKMVPSRFIQEMQGKVKPSISENQNEIPILGAGIRVFHKAFGNGVVMDVDEMVVYIRFDDFGDKTLSLDWCVDGGLTVY